MVPRHCSTLAGGRRVGFVRCALPAVQGLCGGRCCMVAVRVIRTSWGRGGGSGLWPVFGQSIPGLPRCRTRAVRRAAKLSHIRAACAAGAASSVWMAGHTCPAANAPIWWIAKTGHKFSVAGEFARSWGGMTSACCWPCGWNLHVADHSLGCYHVWGAQGQRQ